MQTEQMGNLLSFPFRGGKAQEFKHHDLVSTLISHTAVDAKPFHDFS
jgi:hypothetical protein